MAGSVIACVAVRLRGAADAGGASENPHEGERALDRETNVQPEAAGGKTPAGAGNSEAHGHGVISCAMHGLLTGGRAGASLTHIKDEADFEQRVLRADRPVLMVFYKGGCPTCLLLHPALRQLAEEYRDRVTFASLELMKPYFVVTSREVKKRYHVAFYPTVILFVNGRERKRWVLNYRLAAYRKVLDEVTAAPPANETPAGDGGPAGTS
jgi:thioredoxin 1